MSEYRTIAVDVRGPAWVITLSRPDKLNALDPQMLTELLRAFRDLRDSDAKAMVLTGSGRLFSAGVDLGTPFFMEHVDDSSVYSGKRLLDDQHRVIEAIYNLPIPTLAALNGHACGGGGLGLAMACDLRYAVEHARMWMVPGALDVVQDFGLSWLVQRLVGPSRALHMAMTGYRVGGDEALNWGLVNEVHPDVESLGRAIDDFVDRVADQGADALEMLKTIVRLGASSSLHEQLQVEAIANGLAFQSEEFASKKQAYLSKFGGDR